MRPSFSYCLSVPGASPALSAASRMVKYIRCYPFTACAIKYMGLLSPRQPRNYLKAGAFMAARHTARVGNYSSVRFTVAPSLTWIFGAPKKGSFDSERGLVEYVLRFINGDESPVEPDATKASAHPLLQPEALATARQDWRAALRRYVSTFHTNRAAAFHLVPAHLRVFRPTMKWEGAHLDLWVPIDSPDTFRAYFVSMLEDDSRPFGRALCRCRYKGDGTVPRCAREFLEQKPPTGRPQRLYCSREHMLKAHAARER